MDQHLRIILIDIDHRGSWDDGLNIWHFSPYSPHWWQTVVVIIDCSELAIFPIVIRTLFEVIEQDGVVDVIVVFVIDDWVVMHDGVGVYYGVLVFWVGGVVLIGE